MEDTIARPNEAKKKEIEKEKEMKIPVFSVLKKGTILKNIFLNSPPPPPRETNSPAESGEDGDVSCGQEDEPEEPILIGRHPDCHIVLDHPSISRFHLEVRADPICQKLSVVDLSSVHGTWVSGNKIEPGIPVDMVEGDAIRLGSSTRVYELHWFSLNRVFEMERPLGTLLEDNEEIHQEEIHELPVSNGDDKWVSEIPSAPPMPESMHSSSPPEFLSSKSKMVEKGSSATISSLLVSILESASPQLSIDRENRIQEDDLPATEIPVEKEYQTPLRSERQINSSSLLSRRSKSVGLLHIPSASGRSKERTCGMNFDLDVEVVEVQEDNSENFELAIREETAQKVLFADLDVKEGETDGDDDEIFVSAKDNMMPQSSFDQELRESYNELHIPSPDTMAAFDVKEAFYSNKENWTPESSRISKSMRRIFKHAKMDRGEEGTAASDQENSALDVFPRQPLSNCFTELQNVGDNEFDSDTENGGHEVLNVAEFMEPVSENGFDSDTENGGHEVLNVVEFMEPVSENGFDSDTENGGHEVLNVAEFMEPVSENGFDSDTENGGHEVLNVAEFMEPVSENRARNEMEVEMFASDEENLTPDISVSRRSDKGLRMPFSNALKAFGVEDDIFSSDKENWTPEVPREQRLKKSTSVSCIKNGRDEDSFASDKENLTPYMPGSLKLKKQLSESCAKLERGIMEKRLDRIPFQPLLENSPMRNTSSVDQAQKRMANKGDIASANSLLGDRNLDIYTGKMLDQNISTMDLAQVRSKGGEEKKKWNMVVDTSCLLDGESKKSLQLLEGLKGTHLIIPRMVIRELDCLKQRERWFTRTSKASSALQWIEECMVKTSWWIHVQSSLEMTPVAPTPPTTPHSPLDEGSSEFASASVYNMPFSTCGSFSEILSPTAEDHILDCALFFKRMKTDGQLVLLTDNITLKIKAMAEGLLCETPTEFRESLTNPYSKRFLWAESSPRGSTWSFSDEMGLMGDYYYQVPLVRKATRAVEVAKGLKLILLHNSHYWQTSAVK